MANNQNTWYYYSRCVAEALSCIGIMLLVIFCTSMLLCGMYIMAKDIQHQAENAKKYLTEDPIDFLNASLSVTFGFVQAVFVFLLLCLVVLLIVTGCVCCDNICSTKDYPVASDVTIRVSLQEQEQWLQRQNRQNRNKPTAREDLPPPYNSCMCSSKRRGEIWRLMYVLSN